MYAWTGTAHASTSTRTTFSLINDRIRAILAARGTPQRVLSSITWNAQENTALAASLEIQDRIRVKFRGQVQDSRIVGIKHDLSGDRWMMTLDLTT